MQTQAVTIRECDLGVTLNQRLASIFVSEWQAVHRVAIRLGDKQMEYASLLAIVDGAIVGSRADVARKMCHSSSFRSD